MKLSVVLVLFSVLAATSAQLFINSPALLLRSSGCSTCPNSCCGGLLLRRPFPAAAATAAPESAAAGPAASAASAAAANAARESASPTSARCRASNRLRLTHQDVVENEDCDKK